MAIKSDDVKLLTEIGAHSKQPLLVFDC